MQLISTSTGVNLFVFPVSSRTVVFKEMTGYLMCVNGMLKAQASYMQSLETIDPVKLREHREQEAAKEAREGHAKKGPSQSESPLVTPAGLKLKEVVGKALELHTKLHADITPAKRDFAIGKLQSHDLTEMWRLLRMFFVPCIGLSASMDLMQRHASQFDWSHQTDRSEKQVANLHFLMKELHGPFAQMTKETDAAIQHVLIILELIKAPKKKPDEESRGEEAVPGSTGFAAAYKKKVDAFYDSKKVTLMDWCTEHDITLPDDFFESTFVKPDNPVIKDEHAREKYQRQLFFILYLEYLLHKASCALLDLVLWADKKKQDGTMKRNRLIFPGAF
jgi:hypothetical protein